MKKTSLVSQYTNYHKLEIVSTSSKIAVQAL